MDLEKQTEDARKNWEFEPSLKLLKRKKRNFLIRLLQTLFPFMFKYRVQALYRLTKEEWLDSSDLQKLYFPFDSMPIQGAFKLNNGWKIAYKDLKTVTDGPLFEEDGITIIVPEKSFYEVVKQWASLWRPALIPIIVGLLYKYTGILDWLN